MVFFSTLKYKWNDVITKTGEHFPSIISSTRPSTIGLIFAMALEKFPSERSRRGSPAAPVGFRGHWGPTAPASDKNKHRLRLGQKAADTAWPEQPTHCRTDLRSRGSTETHSKRHRHEKEKNYKDKLQKTKDDIKGKRRASGPRTAHIARYASTFMGSG